MMSRSCLLRKKSGDLAGQVTVLPTAAQISAADSVQCATAIRQTQPSSLSVVSRSYLETSLFEAVFSFDHCYQQSRTMDAFLSSLSAI
ncbi:hypothetical protein TNCV_1259571 [Trichonephila clavipes]|nr:hypothetical protein TNCV_1259571 [Trichonephila clavipes]